MVIKGRLNIRLREKNICLDEGEIFIIPRGIEHKPVAEKEVHVLMFEPKGTVNTGDTASDKKIDLLEKI
jgi:mannose-6-phosphate isomerase-like protein (cupin superfamily)